jgi:hypothetical protein
VCVTDDVDALAAEKLPPLRTTLTDDARPGTAQPARSLRASRGPQISVSRPQNR